MSTDGFDHFRETARLAISADPSTREEIAESSEVADTEQSQEADVTDMDTRQHAVTSLKGGSLFVREIAVPEVVEEH